MSDARGCARGSGVVAARAAATAHACIASRSEAATCCTEVVRSTCPACAQHAPSVCTAHMHAQPGAVQSLLDTPALGSPCTDPNVTPCRVTYVVLREVPSLPISQQAACLSRTPPASRRRDQPWTTLNSGETAALGLQACGSDARNPLPMQNKANACMCRVRPNQARDGVAHTGLQDLSRMHPVITSLHTNTCQ